MRRTLVIFTCCIAVVGLGVVAGASTTAKKTPTKIQKPKTSMLRAHQPRLWGKVTAVNAKAMTITVHNWKNGNHTITLNSKTQLLEGGSHIKLDKITVGSIVLIDYKMQDKSMVAASVHLRRKAMMAPKAKSKK